MGLIRCRHTCGVGHRGLGIDIWPQLTGTISIDDQFIIDFQPIAPEHLQFRHQNVQTNNDFWTIAHARFKDQISAKRPSARTRNNRNNNLNLATVVVDIYVENQATSLRIGVNESYRINVSDDGPSGVNKTVTVLIEATTIFGVRHGIETLAQMIIYDDIRDVFLMRSNVRLADGPVYMHRGISLDTARNFYPVEDIKRTIGKCDCIIYF